MDESDASNDAERLSAGAHTGHRLVVGLCALNILWSVTAWSQRSQFFGQRSDCALGLEVRALAVARQTPPAPAEIGLLSSAPSGLYVYQVQSNGVPIAIDTCPLPTGFDVLASADLDRSGKACFIAMDALQGEVLILRRTAEHTFTRASYHVPPAQRMIAADINNDGRPDLLFFGRTTAGVVTLLNKRPGVFVRGPVLFPDLSVADLQVRDLDGDGVNDVFLLDWLSNKLDVYYGIARMVFSEQLSVDLPGEPGALSVGPVSRARTVRIAVSLPAAHKIVVYDGNALGDFELARSIECPSPPEDLALEDVDGDGVPEVVSGTNRGILLRTGSRTSGPERLEFFSPPATANLWTLDDVDGDGTPDLIAVDRRSHTLCVEFNDARQAPPGENAVYAVGVDPHGVALADMDHDGIPDLLVANQGSNTVSVLLNRGNAQFHGQRSTLVGESPSCVVPLEGSIPGFVVSGGFEGQVRVVTYQDGRTNAMTVAMPGGRNTEVLEASFNPTKRRIEIMLRTHPDQGRGAMLTFLEQLSRRQFLERAIRPSVRSTVLAATARHQEGGLAVLYATNDEKTGRTTVFISTATSQFQFGALRSLFSFPDSTSSTFLLSWGHPAADTISIAAVALGEPEDAIGVFRMKGDTLANPVQWIKGFRPMDDSALILDDVDGDGLPDLVVADARRKALYLFRGEDDFGFFAPVPVAPAGHIGDFAIGHLRSSRASDLVLSDRRNGTVEILLDAFRRHGE